MLPNRSPIALHSTAMRGFSLIELLVVVAIIAVLAAMGVPMYQGYLESVKEEDAKQGLASIYMMQEQYKSVSGSYYTGRNCCSTSSTDDITQNLFGGKESLNRDHYWYAVQRKGSNGYVALARAQSGGDTFCLDNFNKKSWPPSAPSNRRITC